MTRHSDGAVVCPACEYRTADPLDWSEMGLRNEDGYASETTCPRCGARFAVTIYLSYSFSTKELAHDRAAP